MMSILSFGKELTPLPYCSYLDLTKFKAIADYKSLVAIMKISVLIVQKTFWEKEKMLLTSIFSFPKNVFNSLSPPREVGNVW